MAFSWHVKRQITFFILFLGVILLAIAIGVYILLPAPSCKDEKINQGEEQIDCGGPCAPCLTEKADDLIVLWSRFFEVRPGVYDVAALVENVNLTLGSDNVPYIFEIYDEFDSRITFLRGTTYVLPNKQLLLFGANLETGIRRPQRLAFRFQSFDWQYTNEQALPIIVSRTKRDFNQDRPRLIITLTNNAIYDVQDVDVAVMLIDSAGNALAVSEVHIDTIPDSGTAEAAFVWPRPFTQEPSDIRIFVRKKP